jgi:choloylglycine hydrolase
MCTAVSFKTSDHYFGRNLDLEYSYQEAVTITPRNYPFRFRRAAAIETHYAMIGIATVSDGYPLYYEATNEKGLSMAGLNFPGLAIYLPEKNGMENITPFEFIPWILSQCTSVSEAKTRLDKLNLVNIPFSEQFPVSPLHWIISDQEQSITVEPMAEGLRIFDNPIGILTNNPTFDFHLYNLRNYLNVSIDPAINRFSAHFDMEPYSNGMGGIGLPGDFSSASRFVKAAFVKFNSVCGENEEERVGQFFRILSSVAMPRGSVRMAPDKYEITVYSCCCNTNKGIYYYTTYNHCRIIGIDMHREDLDGSFPVSYPLLKKQTIEIQN